MVRKAIKTGILWREQLTQVTQVAYTALLYGYSILLAGLLRISLPIIE